MASRPVMLLGNLASILLTIVALLQYVSWTIVGALILAILSITTLIPTTNPISKSNSHPTNKRTSGHPILDTKQSRERTLDRQAVRPHQVPPRPETKPPARNDLQRAALQSRSEFQKTMVPKIVPPKTIPASVGPTRTGLGKQGSSKQEILRPIPPQISPPSPSNVRPPPPKVDPNVRIIGKGDYGTYDLQLERGIEVTCEVSASSLVNVYILNEENLTGLDLGEEFWSETGEEGVTKTTLSFVAPESGKWFLVVENADTSEVSATSNIKKSPARTSQKN